ncbi:hypothetical protein SAMN04488109_4754 [Chryseolinea serpens]|uniref:YD repeat-containing protein n=2 Tax=Chryseolinea serpens TaxID=947013 RepID=A0A1M5ULD0_9BACT|nr:hypothetical protein SAMN04488109_4754 [Chryseolinea serpens]
MRFSYGARLFGTCFLRVAPGVMMGNPLTRVMEVDALLAHSLDKLSQRWGIIFTQGPCNTCRAVCVSLHMPDRPLIAKWFIVRAAFPFVGAAIVLALATCQHGNEAPFKKTCLPTHMIRLFDSLAFTYDASDRPTTLQYWSGDVMRQQYVMTYGGHVTKCTRWQDNVEKESFSFIYDILGKPVARLRLVSGIATGDSALYSHDEAGRLVQMEFRSNGVFQRRTRYEYDGDNNVRKIYKQTGDKRERIVFEHLSFDRRKRFFGYSPELAIVEIYLLEAEPSVNNVTQLNIYYPTPEDVYPLPYPIDYYIGYTPDTLISQSHDFFTYDTLLTEFTNANYVCH